MSHRDLSLTRQRAHTGGHGHEPVPAAAAAVAVDHGAVVHVARRTARARRRRGFDSGLDTAQYMVRLGQVKLC